MSDEEPKEGATPESPGQSPEDEAAAKAAKAEAAARAKAEREAAEAAKPPWERDPAPPQWEDAAEDPLVQELMTRYSEVIGSARIMAGELTLTVRRESIRDLCRSLKEEHGFHLLTDICGCHFPDRESEPFEVVYHVFNVETNRRVRLKVATDETAAVPSVSTVWKGANWLEREAWDMFGLRFADHPDMTRILLWEGFNGHPLRKDFPVEGIDTGAAIYPEYYEEQAGPVNDAGTGWKPPQPEAESAEEEES